MPGSSLLRSLSTFGVVILGAASACVHAASLPLTLVPSRDQNIIGDELIRGIVTTGPASVHGPEMVSTGPVFVGDEAAAIRIDSTARGTWMLDLEFAETLDMLGYSSFRFAFHPGGASGMQLAMGLGEYDL